MTALQRAVAIVNSTESVARGHLGDNSRDREPVVASASNSSRSSRDTSLSESRRVFSRVMPGNCGRYPTRNQTHSTPSKLFCLHGPCCCRFFLGGHYSLGQGG